ncbi:MAG: hypothetical protein NVSMB6_17430 [Burkholderiaceae bacterium]
MPRFIFVRGRIAALATGALSYSVDALAAEAGTGAMRSVTGLGQVAVVLLLVVALIAGMAWLMRRLGLARNGGNSAVRVVGNVNLSNRERILVVEVADQWIVVGVTTASINTLASMPRQNQAVERSPCEAPPAANNFALWLKQTIDKRSVGGARGSTPANTYNSKFGGLHGDESDGPKIDRSDTGDDSINTRRGPDGA